MTDNNHPITPPPGLIAKWAASICGYHEAARWGADQELEACINWLHENDWKTVYKHLRAARRPPNLKEQALAALSRLNSGALCANPVTDKEIIRRALESLPD